ncbi:MAG: cytochrome P450 [Planctomycetota bacterium]
MTAEQDPFREDRAATGIKTMRAEGQDMPLILRLQDVRKTCKDWKTFSNDDPYMIVPHSEADVRSVRQYPIETDPPDHTDYRALVEPFFKRPSSDPEYMERMRDLVGRCLTRALEADEIEVVRDFSLPLQSRSLTMLLDVQESEAELWISWGTHVFKEGDGVSKGAELSDYIQGKFEETADSDGSDFFSTLNRIEFRGRPLTLEEKHGFANMAFAGGRDTVIHTVTSIIAYLAEHPEALEFLREDESRITPATEEFVRWVSPLTAIARKCPHGAQVRDAEVAPGERVGLCWPSANRDESAFKNPDDVVLDRAPNPHVGFGFGIHKCLGSPQARLIIRSVLQALCERVGTIRLIEAVPEVEEESSFSRRVGYSKLRVAFEPRA